MYYFHIKSKKINCLFLARFLENCHQKLDKCDWGYNFRTPSIEDRVCQVCDVDVNYNWK